MFRSGLAGSAFGLLSAASLRFKGLGVEYPAMVRIIVTVESIYIYIYIYIHTKNPILSIQALVLDRSYADAYRDPDGKPTLMIRAPKFYTLNPYEGPYLGS